MAPNQTISCLWVSRKCDADTILDDGIRVNGPLRSWTDIANPKKRRDFPFPESLRKDCDDYYVNNYIRW